MSWEAGTVWWLIAGMGIGTYAIRFSFLGLLGDRTLPPWVLRHLRYTAVAVLPGIVAPALLSGGGPDPALLAAVAGAVAAGVWTRSAIWAAAAGFAVVAAGLAL